jgi:hypothetical protein
VPSQSLRSASGGLFAQKHNRGTPASRRQAAVRERAERRRSECVRVQVRLVKRLVKPGAIRHRRKPPHGFGLSALAMLWCSAT